MTKCDVYFEDDEKRYEGQYDIDDNTLEVEVFNHCFSNEDYVPIGADVNVNIKMLKKWKIKMYSFPTFTPLFVPLYRLAFL